MSPGGKRLEEARRDREKRFAELREREGRGRLSEKEKLEFRQLDAKRQLVERLEADEKREDADREQRRLKHLEQARAEAHGLPPGDGDFNSEAKLHGERLAKLNRAREVAVAAAKNDLIQRIDRIKTIEQQRHDAWIARRKETNK